ncbi:E3 ubiquitin-protein ligase SIRP1-like [Salvia splendens]|nr:E3 ubiquitin-protein ligase SIRP1-like [Salvia splendens]
MSSMEQARYWCHMCSQTVNPITDSEAMTCPVCGSGFLEEEISESNNRALSLWAPILLSMMANPIRPRPLMETEAEDGSQLTTRRRSRNSAAILQFLQSIRAGMLADHHNQEREAQAQRVILINPFNQTIVLQGDRPPFASLGDYFIGPGLDLLLQHLSENDANRYGTLPAQKEVIDALPSVTIHEPMQCAVCLDDCDEGAHLKEMPCKHKFHEMCIGPWLDLHSSCPVCRYQLPADDSKLVSDNSTPDNRISDNGRRFSVPLFWPFTALVQSHDAPTPPSATEDHEN